ncbi:MAG TPA: cation:proton antiporter [Burkholderiaceae bacterium]|nr:cation:proton antiporter [Burkholderiaceae bacterium]
MHAAPDFPHLREILLFLALAGVLIPLLQRLRVNQVLGFLAAGALLGPFGLGRLADSVPWLAAIAFTELEGVAVLAELGVLFLMFTIGLELSPARLRALRRWVAGAGTAQLLASAAAIGGLARAFGNPWPLSVVLGLVLALSSTAVVMQLLEQRRALGTPLGQATFGVLMLQDLAVVPLLIVVGVLADGHRAALQGAPPGAALGAAAALLGGSLAKAAIAIGAIVWIGGRLLRPLFRALAAGRGPDVFVALTLLCALGTGALTAAAGLSMALGALLAGLLLSESEFRHEVEVTIEPFRGLLMGLFFISVGMGVDPAEAARSPGWLLASVLGLFAIKAAVVALVFRAGGLSWGTAIEGGLLMGQGGEFAFIVIGVAQAAGLMPREVAQFMLLVVALGLFATPFAAHAGRTIRERLERAPEGTDLDVPPAGALAGPVVIAGFGRVGETLGAIFDARGVGWVAIETDAARVAVCRARGLPVWSGDATRTGLLKRIGVAGAAAVVLTMDRPASALHALRAIRREIDPDVPVIARSRDEAHAAVLRDEGASVVIPETLEASLQLAAVALQATGVDEPAAQRAIDAERERRIGGLRG